ncbi:M28 family metallopeptidase [Flavobacteriaceae bacterium]|nr:M28 family metallopeptidase [Flavobacteriaceae bacterium]MDA7716774.1 M28 family metallopeptidase [Flavobacteriaceae bacterium]MDB4007226.1 M28 family metallopeptidase [Flavobacteriaceae bacterium]MDB4023788.1 M28 family metallopeptidase [Flavobacteriaceae bacterium]MDB4131784.1 M28 family metallopeptidase [Flavobacteriaceae bacterium]
MNYFKLIPIFIFTSLCYSQSEENYYNIIDSVSENRIESNIKKLVSFGTRHTLSDTTSVTTGIGAARRWIKKSFENISSDCNNCLEVFYQKNYFIKNKRRLIKDVWINNVVAIQRGVVNPNRYIIMSGDIDSRVSDPNDYTSLSPGANDNASGMAGVIEAARVLSKYEFDNSIIYVGLSGEEQGLYGGAGLANFAKKNNWEIIGILNNDMIGNIEGVDGVIDNFSFRIFSEPTPANESEVSIRRRRFYGGEVDGNSRQLARYIHKTVRKYMPEMNPMMIYRLDRFGRGGHHRPFNDLGYAGVRIMEAHENYNRQHQDIRTENSIEYGDVISGVNFKYAKKLTAVNAINLASLGWSPKEPKNVKIGGAVKPSTKLKWEKPKNSKILGYKIYWRETTSPYWENSRFVGNINQFTLKGIVIDNYLFGVSSVGNNNQESVIVFPSEVFN